MPNSAARNRSSRPRSSQRRNLFATHKQLAMASLRQLLRTPGTAAPVILVIALAMVLPALMLLITDNLRANLGDATEAAVITAYFELGTTETRIQEVSERLQALSAIVSVDYVSSAAALEQFSEASGLGATLQSLAQNPLPAALIVTPGSADTETARSIETALLEFSEIELVQLDYLWLQRLQALIAFANRLGAVLVLVVAVGLIAIIGNVIRMGVENRREEIRIIKQFGGTNGFIARPFLYSGLLLGAAGGMLASLLLLLLSGLLGGAIAELAALYGGSVQIAGMGLIGSISLVLLGAGLGWISALLSVLRKIATISP